MYPHNGISNNCENEWAGGELQTWTQNTLQDNSEEKKVLRLSEKRGGQGDLLLFSERNSGRIN